MIRYLTTAAHSYTMGLYLNCWGRALTDRIRIVPYRLVTLGGELPAGTYIFSDVDRLAPAARRKAARLRRAIGERGAAWRALNHPERSLGRRELLEALHREGVNDFRARRADRAADDPSDLTFPVFVRPAVAHAGSRTGLLRSPAELRRRLRAMEEASDLERLLVVEFCDTVDEGGVYRKYAAFCVDGEIVPRHCVFSRDWMLKYPDMLGPAELDEEAAYLRENPHADRLRAIFDRAHIAYGRIDYGLRDGRVQVWEINTNPMVMLAPDRYEPRHLAHQQWFHERIAAAFRRLDAAPASGQEGSLLHRLTTAGARAWSGMHRLYGTYLVG